MLESQVFFKTIFQNNHTTSSILSNDGPQREDTDDPGFP